MHVHCDISDNAPLRGGHLHDLDLSVNMLGLCDPSNLLFAIYPPRNDALFSNCFEDLLLMRALGQYSGRLTDAAHLYTGEIEITRTAD